MVRRPIFTLMSCIGQEVTIKGWVETVRKQKKVQFLIVRDYTGMVQVVNERKGDVLDKTIDSLTQHSTVIVRGVVVSNPSVKLNQLEIQAKEVSISSQAESPLPIGPNTNLDQRLDWRFIDLRRPENRLVMEVQTTAEHAMRQYWVDHGFIEIHSPKLMGSPSESGAELFKVGYFGGVAYLAQSPQFYKQMAMASGLEKVFEIGPVFRANPSFTSRHDTEFTSVDVEISWVNSHEDVMQFEEVWLKHVLESIKRKHGKQIQQLFGQEITIPTIPFPRITMQKAKEILRTTYNHNLPEHEDLDPEGERLLAKYVEEIHGHQFVFVTDYPIEVRPFYHMRHESNPKLTKSFDLLWKGLEITTGAQREHRYEVLKKQVLEKGLTLEGISFYLDFFRYGCPPHGGFGFGLTRMLMLLLGLKNVREVTYLYRGPNRLTP